MADTRPTPVSFIRAVKLCFLLLFSPSRLIEAEEQDVTDRNGYVGAEKPIHRAYIVRWAFVSSLLLVLFSAAVGCCAAKLVAFLGRCSTSETTMWLQVAGASLLLWGTLFVRGWEIQSFSGVVFTERVNQWLYRSLYCAGTAIVIYSLVVVPCKP